MNIIKLLMTVLNVVSKTFSFFKAKKTEKETQETEKEIKKNTTEIKDLEKDVESSKKDLDKIEEKAKDKIADVSHISSIDELSRIYDNEKN